MKPAWQKRLREEWRGVYEPRELKNNAKVVGDVLPELMKKLGLNERYAEEEIARAWTQIVGHPLCTQALPTKIVRKVLHIRVLQPTIHFVIEGMREEILVKLQERFGTRISGVKITRG